MKQKLTTPGQLKWLSKLMAFDFEITYKKGVENVVADAHSRVHSSEIFCMAITSVSIDIYPLIQATWDTDSCRKTLISELKQNLNTKSKYSWIGEQLRRKGRLVVGDDQDLRLKIINLFYNTSSGGHSGVLATYKRLSSLFYWPNMEKQIRNYSRECDICQRYNMITLPTRGYCSHCLFQKRLGLRSALIPCPIVNLLYWWWLIDSPSMLTS